MIKSNKEVIFHADSWQSITNLKKEASRDIESHHHLACHRLAKCQRPVQGSIAHFTIQTS
ncbi:hypothetical protein PAHAL_2G278900 [Panicum hallii]|uniref:Uncharacterized protein n=1 Tax=Panicum hallii TaxID=206008 RepID=A0A2T8KQM8_9POAL|nr:hypothetical protein PAHAL_2G278900 [Panicum hallii]